MAALPALVFAVSHTWGCVPAYAHLLTHHFQTGEPQALHELTGAAEPGPEGTPGCRPDHVTISLGIPALGPAQLPTALRTRDRRPFCTPSARFPCPESPASNETRPHRARDAARPTPTRPTVTGALATPGRAGCVLWASRRRAFGGQSPTGDVHPLVACLGRRQLSLALVCLLAQPFQLTAAV